LNNGLVFGVFLDSDNEVVGVNVITGLEGGSGFFEFVFLFFDGFDGGSVGSDLLFQLGGGDLQVIGGLLIVGLFNGVDGFLQGDLDFGVGDTFIENGLEFELRFITSGGSGDLVNLDLVFFKGGVLGFEFSLFL